MNLVGLKAMTALGILALMTEVAPVQYEELEAMIKQYQSKV